jgi:F420-dependent methylenetetrahydromethanopterin dehydrogenase
MALDYFQRIYVSTKYTTEQKEAILRDFCEAKGYTAIILVLNPETLIFEEKPNPITMREFFNSDIHHYISQTIKNRRVQIEIDKIVVETMEE